MKKVIAVSMVAVLAVVGAQADIYTGFGSSYGVVDVDNVTPLLGNGEQALVQLIYAGVNGVIDGPAGIGGAVSGDDIILFAGLTDPAVAGDFNTEYGLFGTVVGPVAGFAGGNVYGRMFQDDAASASSYYYEGHVQLMSDFVQSGPLGPPAESYDIGQGAFAVADQQVIPEPATIGLMGIAGLGMFLARRKVRA